jgi:uncharacterized protein GlcG (DUF336 family)
MLRHRDRLLYTILSVALITACSGGGGGSSGTPSDLGDSGGAVFSGATSAAGAAGTPLGPTNRVCDGSCALNASMSGTNRLSLGVPQVATILDQAVREATARGLFATIAVVDRVGNVLAVVEMGNGVPPTRATQTINIGSNPASLAFPGNGLEDVPGGPNEPLTATGNTAQAVTNFMNAGGNAAAAVASPLISARFAAVSKAITAAYLSTEGNAFSTETASQIIQENFNPGQGNRAGGPLFGVQISQLVCDDITRRQAIVGGAAQAMAGPKSAPIGFSGDPGGIPLYMSGEAVGGIGVEIDGTYSVQTNIVSRTFTSNEAIVALAGQRGFRPNRDRRADLITVDGLSLRYIDSIDMPFASPAAATLVSSTAAPAGSSFVNVLNFFQAAGGIQPGTAFLTTPSGYRPATMLGTVPLGGVARILVNPDDTAYLGQNIFDPTANPAATTAVGPGAVTNPRASFSPTIANGGLTDVEAATLVASGLQVARQSRAQIRRGVGGPGLPFMEVNVSVVDLAGNLLAFAGTPDAPVFGTTVSIQKARASAFFSRMGGEDPVVATSAAQDLQADVEPGLLGINFQTQPIGQYVTDLRTFLQDPTALANGIAFADRSIGNLARPFFPDGINDSSVFGPFSQPIFQWSPFNTGLQLDLVLDRLLAGLLVSAEGNPAGIVTSCTGPNLLELRGGIQIFPGSVAIFKNGKLVGGMGISGDGVDQDDLIAFEGVKRAGLVLAPTSGGIGSAGSEVIGGVTQLFVGNAPPAVRSDQIRVSVPGQQTGNIRYVNCPPAPFLNSSAQNVCQD